MVAAGRCGNCRFNALHAFASLAGISLLPPSTQASHPANPTSIRKPFSTSLLRRNETSQPKTVQDSSAEEAAGVLDGDTPEAAPQHAESNLPWYLQVAGPPKQETPLSARQQLPPIPEDSPELLKPFLEHLSENIGLDDLILLDLRVLDPPPALGANLMMVIGTARSERHLHVSADRFCRWLRTNYKLSPYADGLLGRNELKLKMRRKARRIKLLSSVGSKDDKIVDDGIRTGWVCVNVGDIEEGEQELQEVDDSNTFVGFGGSNNGARLVVQMMTEEKREELDLETLWGGYIARQQRKEAREAKMDSEMMPEPLQQVGDAFSNTQCHADASPLVLSHPREMTRFSATQQRNLHTAATRWNITRSFSLPKTPRRRYSFSASVNTSHNQLEAFNTQSAEMDVDSSHEVKAASKDHLSQVEEQDEGSNEFELEPQIKPANQPNLSNSSDATNPLAEEETRMTPISLIKYLDRLPPEEARRALGQGPDDESSTSFLQTYYQLVQNLEDDGQFQFRVKPTQLRIESDYLEYCRALLLSRGVARNHPEYTKTRLLEHFHSLQMSSSIITTATYIDYIKGFAVPDYELDLAPATAPPEQLSPSQQVSHVRPQTQKVVSHESLNMIFEVLEDMHLRGINLAHKEILSTLCLAVARAQFSEQDANQPNIQPDAAHEITQIMFRHRLPAMGISYYEELLECFANAGDWPAYWKCWRGLARRSQPRPSRLYQNLFRHIANTGNQKLCLSALREWVPEMEREDPPVALQGDQVLIYEITRSLRIADPRSEQLAVENEGYGEWSRLWWRLSDASQPALDPQDDVSPDAHLKKPMFYNPSLAEYRFENRGDEVEEEGNYSQLYALKT